MDFTGRTPEEAASTLWQFVNNLAAELSVPLMLGNGTFPDPLNDKEVSASGQGLNGKVFFIQFSCSRNSQTNVTRQIRPLEREFGAGHITTRGAAINMKLRLDTDARYRWYGDPVLLDENVKRVIPTDGSPFPLTEDYVADGLLALLEKTELRADTQLADSSPSGWL
jgi:hypothetical protein